MNSFLTRRRMLAASAGAAAIGPAALSGRAHAAPSQVASTGPVAVERVPRRIFDSRTDGLLGGNRLQSGNSVTIIVGTAEGFPFSQAVFLNCTVTQTQGWGWLTIFAADDSGEIPIPQTSNVNWSANDQTLANVVLAPIGTEASVTVMCGGTGATHFILDVQGYVPVTTI